jgi:hypothetical protein
MATCAGSAHESTGPGARENELTPQNMLAAARQVENKDARVFLDELLQVQHTRNAVT